MITKNTMIYALKSDTVLLFENIDECSREMGIDGIIISECILNAERYNGWKFIHEFAFGVGI